MSGVEEKVSRNEKIFGLIHREGMPMVDVGEQFGISRQRVSQIYYRMLEEKEKESMVKKKRFEERMPGFACTAEQKEAIDRVTDDNYLYSNLMRDALDMILHEIDEEYGSDTEQGVS